MTSNTANFGNEITRKISLNIEKTRLLTARVMCLVLCILVGLCSACGSPTTVSSSSQVSRTQTQTFSTTKQPTIVVKGAVAKINVHAGNDNAVVATITEQADTQAKLGALQVTAKQNGDTVTINTPSLDDSKNESINLDIATAVTTNLTLQVTTGDINVDGIQGNMQLDVPDKGEITASNIKGIVSAHTNNGLITLKQADLSGKSQLETQNGAITFTGTLDPQGDYQFQTSVGPIDVTLPADAAFHLSASSQSGIVTNDFQSDDVGQTPRANLTVMNQKGLVHIHKG